jgi:hypothetical protein
MILLAVMSACALDSGNALLAQRAAPQGFIGGVVRSSNGPEAGVWVIAETKDLPTNFIKIVVTDDQGRYMVPELPAANYRVFVRGYGLVDSTPVQAFRVADLNLTATLAKTPEAARSGPGRLLAALFEPPAAKDFPAPDRPRKATGSARHWRRTTTSTRSSPTAALHRLGNEETRTVDHAQGQARAEDTRRSLGMAARHRRAARRCNVLSNQGKVCSRTTPDGPSALPGARSRPRRRVRRASSATSSSRCGTWATITRSCTRDLDRQESSDGERWRKRVPSAGHGNGRFDPNENKTSPSTSRRARRRKKSSPFPRAEPPVASLGQRASLGESAVRSGTITRCSTARPRVDDAEDPATRTRPGKSACKLPMARCRAAGGKRLLRSEDQAVHADRHVLSAHHLQFDNDPDETVYFNELVGPMFGWIDTKV